ncbi:MAG TPA: LCP family protein, partial [Bacilli bacterium]
MSSITNLPPRQDPGLSKRREKRGFLKTALFVLLFVILISIVFIVYILFKFDGMLGKTSLPSPDVSIGEPALKPNETITSKPTAILILGLDTRKETGSLNTDVIMVASFRPDGKYAALVSIPRDTYMKPEGYRARKANAFYSVAMRGDKEKANDVVKKIFGDYLDIKVDYILKIDFKTF